MSSRQICINFVITNKDIPVICNVLYLKYTEITVILYGFKLYA